MPCKAVCTAMCKCAFGAAPSSLVVLPVNRVLGCNMPAANAMDSKPLVNVLPFGVCMSLANPTVAAATAAAFGVLTPMPCIPVIAGMWVSTSPTTMIGTFPTINMGDIVMCAYGGVINILQPGQMTVL